MANKKPTTTDSSNTLITFKLPTSPQEFSIDPAHLTLDEIAEVEREFDCSYKNVPFDSMRFTLVMLRLAVRRGNPGMLDEVGTFQVSQIEWTKRPTKEGRKPSGDQN